jgi:hypothetical protein
MPTEIPGLSDSVSERTIRIVAANYRGLPLMLERERLLLADELDRKHTEIEGGLAAVILLLLILLSDASELWALIALPVYAYWNWRMEKRSNRRQDRVAELDEAIADLLRRPAADHANDA